MCKEGAEGALEKGQAEDSIKAIREPLLSWFKANARDLPWRKSREPYPIWISEIMLQQTRVEAVKPYFERFMEAFPQIRDLAGAGEEKLLKLWEGLGYYSRAKNLKKAAVLVMEEYGGIMPGSYKELLKLPGIGTYTAGAIASIAYRIPVPAVDGNVMRVLSRFLGSRQDIADPRTKKGFEELLLSSMEQKEPGLFNQGLFEVGALVCVPKGAPKCALCPLFFSCKSGREGLWEEIPVKASKKPRRIEEKTVFVFGSECTGRRCVALRKRPDKGLLASLYEFPAVEGRVGPDGVMEAIGRFGIAREAVCQVSFLGEAKHIFSHVEWHMAGYGIQVKGKLPGTFVSADIRELEGKYPLPSAFLAYKKAFLRQNIEKGRS